MTPPPDRPGALGPGPQKPWPAHSKLEYVELVAPVRSGRVGRCVVPLKPPPHRGFAPGTSVGSW